MARVLSTFLNELDGVSSPNLTSSLSSYENDYFTECDVFVLAASENLDLIDKALLRPGRLSNHIRLGVPGDQDVIDLLLYFTRKFPLSNDVSLDEIAQLISKQKRNVESGAVGPTIATIFSLCREAVQIAIRERIEIDTSQSLSSSTCPALDLSQYVIVDDMSHGEVSQAHFLSAMSVCFPNHNDNDKIAENSCSSLSSLPPFESEVTPEYPKMNTQFNLGGRFTVGTHINDS